MLEIQLYFLMSMQKILFRYFLKQQISNKLSKCKNDAVSIVNQLLNL